MSNTPAWGIDLSKHNNTPNLSGYTARGRMHFVIIKASMGGGWDERLPVHHAAALRAMVPLRGLYHWVDPTQDLRKQADHFSRAIDAYNPNFIAADNEQWWASWYEYYKYISGYMRGSDLRRLSGKKISDFGQDFMGLVRMRYPELWLFNYTARWFINGYSPDMSSWINEYPLWDAHYLDLGSSNIYLRTWDSLAQKISSLDKRILPAGANSWYLWQWATRWILPETRDRLDLNIYNGTPQQMEQDLRRPWSPEYVEHDPSQPIARYIVIAPLGLRVRSGPSELYNRVTALPFGTRFEIYDTVHGTKYTWGKIDPEQSKWVALNWARRIT